ncbi:MAG: HAMP domain-containing histidine kinase [Clostridia bacterium]|nr:HAMP domain-containing histidine kinase [Clostridia bacterium]
MIRRSLTRKMIVVFSAILIAVVVLNIVINGLLLPRVHRENKIRSMETLYLSLKNEYALSSDDEDIVEIVKDSLSNHNLRVFIWDEENNLVIDSLPLSRNDNRDFAKKNVPSNQPFRGDNGSDRYNFQHDFRFDRNNEFFIMELEIPEEHIISSNSEYTLFSVETFENTDEENICLRGNFSNGNRILIQMPVASIDEAVYISNWLLLIVGAIMLIIGIVIVAVTSRSVAKPVKELSGIAQAMKNLDFSVKYESKRTDEIGSLGNSINALSEKLEKTIGELFEKNEKLEKDIELKSKIDTMRKEFIANASHELKTPVALIRGYAEGLGDNIATDYESRKLYTDVIIEEADRMNHIIRQMLELMEIDSTDAILNGQEISLTLLAEEVISSFDVMLKAKDVSITLDYNDECIVTGDRYRICQAITNYISNAINHVDHKKIIRVSLKNYDDKVEFMVYNSGVGISEDEQTAIWERFYKVDKAHTREYGGTGLGLSIVRSVISLHHGEFGVRNMPEGVEFYFTLYKEISDET